MFTPKFAHLNGKIVPWDEAKIHVHAPAAKYGIGVFEGIRGYWSDRDEEMYLFRMHEHLERLAVSQKSMRFTQLHAPTDLAASTLELIRANGFRETVHIRIMLFLDGDGEMGSRAPVGVNITAVPRPTTQQIADGISVQVSSWIRIPDTVMPARIKCNANYHNSRLAIMQAQDDGYDAPLLLNSRGKISEGPTQSFFLIRDGRPITPSPSNDILESITRDTVLTLLREKLGLVPEERDVDRSEILVADEAFFCGTGAEIMPITSIDRIPIGAGNVGPIVRELQQVYADAVRGRLAQYRNWLLPVYRASAQEAAD